MKQFLSIFFEKSKKSAMRARYIASTPPWINT
jgi:hypothetical protein